MGAYQVQNHALPYLFYNQYVYHPSFLLNSLFLVTPASVGMVQIDTGVDLRVLNPGSSKLTQLASTALEKSY